MSSNIPKISIIVPVYKVEEYISKCIESIISQTYTNFELLLIDDGSPDKSPQICDEYSKIDSRIRVFHKKNGGVSAARNFGLDKALGEWITFVDSDDYLESTALYSIDQIICQSGDMDLIQFLSNRSIIDPQIKYNVPIPSDIYAFYRHPVTVWGSVFKREIIDKYHLRFLSELKIGEDQIFLYDYIRCSKCCLILDQRLYYYRANNGSITMNMRHEDIIKTLYAFSSLKKRMPIVASKMDTNLIELFCNKEIINNFNGNELRRIYKDINIRQQDTRAKSAKIFYFLSKLNFNLAYLTLKVYNRNLKGNEPKIP